MAEMQAKFEATKDKLIADIGVMIERLQRNKPASPRRLQRP